MERNGAHVTEPWKVPASQLAPSRLFSVEAFDARCPGCLIFPVGAIALNGWISLLEGLVSLWEVLYCNASALRES